MYQVVASDLDGTLLSPDHRLTPYAKDTLQALTEQGVHFVFATGRHHVDVGQIRDNLGIAAHMITSNGARVHNPEDKLVFTHDLAPDVAGSLYELVYPRRDIVTNIYRGDEWYLNHPRAEDLEYFQEAEFHFNLFRPGEVATDAVSKVFYTSDSHEELVALEHMINTQWGERVNVSFSTLNCLEVMAGGVSKGHALASVADAMGYQLENCIAFGDGMNDKEMLSMAGKGYIMGNAHQRLKDMLPDLEVIGTNGEDAVPRFLQRYFLDNKVIN